MRARPDAGCSSIPVRTRSLRAHPTRCTIVLSPDAWRADNSSVVIEKTGTSRSITSAVASVSPSACASKTGRRSSVMLGSAIPWKGRAGRPVETPDSLDGSEPKVVLASPGVIYD
jgi:hypothetical protein